MDGVELTESKGIIEVLILAAPLSNGAELTKPKTPIVVKEIVL